MTMYEVYNRVCYWNMQRCEQAYNAELLVNMLNEELDEYYIADSLVEKLDALCDIVFIAYGGLWKLNTPEESNAAYHEQARTTMPAIINCSVFSSATYIRGFIDAILNNDEVPVSYTLHIIVSCCVYQAQELGIIEIDDFIKALNIICDSNDTKSINKIDVNEKYSKEGKGNFYVPPTVELNKLLEKIRDNYN